MSGQHKDFIPNTPKELLQQYSKAIVHKLKEVAPYLIKNYSLNNPLQEKTSNKLVKLSKLKSTYFFFGFMVGSTSIKVHYHHLLYWSVNQSLPIS